MMHDCPLQPGRFFARWLLSLSCGTLHTLNLEVQSERWSVFECRQFVCNLARGDSFECVLAGLQESSQRVAMCCWRWYATGRLPVRRCMALLAASARALLQDLLHWQTPKQADMSRQCAEHLSHLYEDIAERKACMLS